MPKIVPRPIARLVENLDAISHAYVDLRSGEEPDDAFDDAIERVLAPEDASEAIAFVHDEDRRFDAGMGPEFKRVTVENLEATYTVKHGLDELMAAAPQGRTTPQPTGDVVAIAEWLAGDKQRSYLYSHSLRKYPDFAKRLLDASVTDILDVAGRAWTNMGRKIKIEQAEKVILLLRNKAAAHPDPQAANQVVWCDALARRLKPLQ